MIRGDVMHFVRRDSVAGFFGGALAVESDLCFGIAALLHRRIIDLLGDTGLLRAGDKGTAVLLADKAPL